MKTKILVIDDTQHIKEEVCDILNMEDFDTICASNADEGLFKIMNEKPDLIITDLKMPGKSGFDLIQLVKSFKELVHIPIVVLSANSEEKNINKAIELGAFAYLNKPCSADQLINTINTALKIRTWKN